MFPFPQHSLAVERGKVQAQLPPAQLCQKGSKSRAGSWDKPPGSLRNYSTGIVLEVKVFNCFFEDSLKHDPPFPHSSTAWPCPPCPQSQGTSLGLLQVQGSSTGMEQAQALSVTLAGQNICYLRFTIEVPQHKNSKKKKPKPKTTPNYSQAENSGALTSQGLRQFYRPTMGQLPDPASTFQILFSLTLSSCGKT